jgi:caffeoyl-CoA O-methyltransferase
MDFLPDHIDAYAEGHSRPENDVLADLNRETWQKVLMPRMLSGPIQGAMLEMFSRMVRPSCVLEIGTYTGYAALCLARGLAPEGKLYTVDINDELAPMVKRYVERAELKDVVLPHFMDASAFLSSFDEPIDLVFIDADKENYQRYLDLVWPKLRPGGWVIADNVLWSGKVTEEVHQDAETVALRQYNENVHASGHFHVLLPVRDGLMVVQKPLG